MATVLTLTANTLVDCLADGPVRPGKVNRVEQFEIVAGGKGLNAGRVLAKLGHKVLAAGFAGGWSGRILEGVVRKDGMEPLLVPTEARTRIGFNVSGVEGAIAFLENGFRVMVHERDALVEAIQGRLSQVALVLISGSVPDESCVDLYARVVEACWREKVPCWIDGYGDAMQRALAVRPPPALVKANREEYGDGRGFGSCPEVHVTDGPQVVDVRSPTGRFVVRPPDLEEKSAIGSGDCYFAALAHARLSGKPLEEQLRWAVAAGAANAALGATARIGEDDIADWLEKVEVQQRLDS
jgi:fructose-1-phosphate kinase PfkB-like protein